VAAASADLVANFKATKYVNAETINAATGVITVTFSNTTPQINGMTLVLTPSINKAALAPGLQGPVDWACGSNTTTTATARGLPVIAGTTLTLQPSINKAALAPGLQGPVDWACGSNLTATATARGLPVTAGTLNAKFAPTECK